ALYSGPDGYIQSAPPVTTTAVQTTSVPYTTTVPVVTTSTAPTSTPVTAQVTFKVTHDAGFGDSVYVVGSFNSWNTCQALALTWSAGNVWTSAPIPVQVGTTYQWKAIAYGSHSQTSCKSPTWEAGSNNVFTATAAQTVSVNSVPQINSSGQLVTDRHRLNDLRERVAGLFNQNLSARRFPGAQPVSFGSVHLSELLEEDYFVSEKADGIRLLLYTRTLPDKKVEAYLIDRKNHYYFHHFGLPLPGLQKSHQNTVLDGELVIDGGKKLFMVFDALFVHDKDVTAKPYTKRLGVKLVLIQNLRENVIKPFMESMKRNPDYLRKFPFEITQKRIEFSYNLHCVFRDMEKYKHETDGLIFTSAVAPYAFATCDKMLKWKPAEENTVDFKILNNRGVYHLGILIKDDNYEDFGELTVDETTAEKWDQDPPFGRIIECRYDPDWPNNWKFSRFRDDKLTSNHISVYHKILESIHDNVTKEQVSFIDVVA
ncbi:Dcp1p-Dcp2p decapping enzyme complex alpha subunit, partial [Boothiomyces sp. JEL0866]